MALSDLLVVSDTYGRFAPGSERATVSGRCRLCGPAAMQVIARNDIDDQRWDLTISPDRSLWLRCPLCHLPAIEVNGVMIPGPAPLSNVRGLPDDVGDAWAEVRLSLSVSAFTAATHMCRKILLHVAVDSGMTAKSPTFQVMVNHLKDQGIITAPMATWVDRIRTLGNEAAHELSQVTEEDAMLAATFTHRLLSLHYETAADLSAAATAADASDQNP